MRPQPHRAIRAPFQAGAEFVTLVSYSARHQMTTLEKGEAGREFELRSFIIRVQETARSPLMEGRNLP